MSETRSAEEVKAIAKATTKSKMEGRFLEAWRRLAGGLPQPVMEYRFTVTRKWRFDFAWPDYLLAVELDGGAFHAGGHVRGAQQAKDYEKMNNAVKLGWRVLRFNTKQMTQPDEVAEFVAEVLCKAKDVG